MSSAPQVRLLQDLLAEARGELRGRAPDSAQDATVLARLRPLLPPPAESAVRSGGGALALRRAAWGGAGLGGAALLLALGLLFIEPPRGALPVLPAHDSGFLPVVSAAEWQQALADYGDEGEAAVLLMPAELPRERLALLGLPYDTRRAAEPVRAELMLNPRGQLLAVRFLE